MKLGVKTYTFGYGTHGVIVLILQQIKPKYYEQYWNRNVDYMEEPERVADTEEIYEPPEEHPVREAVQKLPPKYRLVIHLYYYEEFSVAEIARLTEQKESTVKSQMHRAREMLKQILETGK
jgi:RNA polymerase sigma-70 factor (ECF subfamily)